MRVYRGRIKVSNVRSKSKDGLNRSLHSETKSKERKPPLSKACPLLVLLEFLVLLPNY